MTTTDLLSQRYAARANVLESHGYYQRVMNLTGTAYVAWWFKHDFIAVNHLRAMSDQEWLQFCEMRNLPSTTDES